MNEAELKRRFEEAFKAMKFRPRPPEIGDKLVQVQTVWVDGEEMTVKEFVRRHYGK